MDALELSVYRYDNDHERYSLDIYDRGKTNIHIDFVIVLGAV